MTITKKAIKVLRAKKLKGFTIVETLVAMLLGGMAIAFAAWAFLTVSKNFQHARTDYVFYTEILQLRSVISRDVERAESLKYEDGTLNMQFSNSVTVWYDFYENYTIRSIAEVVDTFHIVCTDFNVGFHSTDPELLLWISFTIYKKGMPWEQFRFYKEYPALLNRGELFNK